MKTNLIIACIVFFGFGVIGCASTADEEIKCRWPATKVCHNDRYPNCECVNWNGNEKD